MKNQKPVVMDNLHVSTRMGTAGGMLTVLLFSLSAGELVKTALLAAVGAAVSFTVSVGLKWVMGKLRDRR